MASDIPANITYIGIPTHSRPARMRAAVASYLANLEAFGRDATVIVCDDAREPAMQQENREALLGLSGDIRYIGRVERQDLADRLARIAGIPTEIARFGLLGEDTVPTYGATRNTLMVLAQAYM